MGVDKKGATTKICSPALSSARSTNAAYDVLIVITAIISRVSGLIGENSRGLTNGKVTDNPAASSNPIVGLGISKHLSQAVCTFSANAPCPLPNTLVFPGMNGHPFGIGESALTIPANSMPGMKGNGG